MSKDFMALMTPNHQTVPIVRQGTLVYLTPTVIPYDRYAGPKSELEICSLMQEIDLTSFNSELRGISVLQDCQYDRIILQRLLTSLRCQQQDIKISGRFMKQMVDLFDIIFRSELRTSISRT